jgi:hypothetical protein
MNRSEAQLILSLYRPSGQDAQDPHLRESLSLAALDPDLKAWFENERASDTAISRALRQQPVPADLRNNLLASRKLIELPRIPLWKRPSLWWAVAAVLTISLTLLSLTPHTNPSHSLAETGVHLITSPGFAFTPAKFHLSLVTNQTDAIQVWLRTSGAPQLGKLPSRLASLNKVGCRTVSSKGQTVGLVCFNTGDGEFVHLLIAPRQPEATTEPTFAQVNNLPTATWSDEDRTYILLSTDPKSKLDRFFTAG